MVRGLGGAARGWRRLFWFSVALIAGTILFLAQARTSLGSSLIALFAVGFMVRRLRWLAIAMVGVGMFVGAYYVLSGANLGIEDEIVAYARRGVSDEHLENLSGRTGLWKIGWEMFKDSPVLGHGFETGVRNEGVKYGLALGTNMHSSYLQVLVDTGTLGSIAWLIYILGMSTKTYKYYRHVGKSDELTRMSAVENLLVVFVIMFRSFLGHVLVSHQLNLMIFLSIYLYTVLRLEGVPHRPRAPVGELETESRKAVLGYRRSPPIRSRGSGLNG
jgi:O-antigen ligase